jgi:hypothetical protein
MAMLLAGVAMFCEARRNQLLRMYTREMSADYEQELGELDRIIAAAVSVGARHPVDEAEQYIA